MHLHFKDSHLNTLDSRVKFSERFNLRAGAYTYAMHLYNQLGERALGLCGSTHNNFVLKYLIHELSTRQIHHGRGRSRSPSIYSLAKHSGTSNNDWYLRYHPAKTQMAQGEVRYDSAHHPEDSRRPWHTPQGIDSYIYKNI
jgi:hypothetical protein